MRKKENQENPFEYFSGSRDPVPGFLLRPENGTSEANEEDEFLGKRLNSVLE